MTTVQFKDTSAYSARVKKQYEYLQREYDKKKELSLQNSFVFDSEYDLTLFFDPLDYSCQKTQAILNYYQISFKRV